MLQCCWLLAPCPSAGPMCLDPQGRAVLLAWLCLHRWGRFCVCEMTRDRASSGAVHTGQGSSVLPPGRQPWLWPVEG